MFVTGRAWVGLFAVASSEPVRLQHDSRAELLSEISLPAADDLVAAGWANSRSRRAHIIAETGEFAHPTARRPSA
jgi:hypothetical protein